jgi:hypothetical protein
MHGDPIIVTSTVKVHPSELGWGVGERNGTELLKLSAAPLIAVFGLVSGAQGQIPKLDILPGLVAVFLVGFWVFASPTMKGKQPLWPETLWRRSGRPAVKAANIQKQVGFHSFRHTYTTLLTQNNEEVEMGQEFLRHANGRITLDLYAQAGMPNKRAGTKQTCSDGAQQGRSPGLTGPNWTMTEIANSLQVLERIGGDDGTRTRGLCRDRVAGRRNLLELNGTDSPFLIL